MAADAADALRALSNSRLSPSTELPAMDFEAYSASWWSWLFFRAANHAGALDSNSSSSLSARVALEAAAARVRAAPEEVLPGKILVAPSSLVVVVILQPYDRVPGSKSEIVLCCNVKSTAPHYLRHNDGQTKLRVYD